MELSFEHLQSAHCENGVTRSLLKDIGISKITEPLAFGIGAGLYYVYIPLLKINNGPVIAFRPLPGLVFKRTCHALGINIIRKKFRSKEKAGLFLDKCLAAGHAVGCQVGVYYLPYFPKEYRFHFNAHNLIVYGKDGDDYLVSDPVMELTAKLSSYELERVRFAKGALAPNGQIYYPEKGTVVTDDIIRKAIIKGVKINTAAMLQPIVPFIGINGIRFTAGRIKQWRDKLGLKQAGLYLAQLVRMQEEIGTGGGGFRYIYGAFLQEAFNYLPVEGLMKASAGFTNAGDLWRTAAVQAAGIYKGRLGSREDFNVMAAYLMEIAEIETQAFKTLKGIQWK